MAIYDLYRKVTCAPAFPPFLADMAACRIQPLLSPKTTNSGTSAPAISPLQPHARRMIEKTANLMQISKSIAVRARAPLALAIAGALATATAIPVAALQGNEITNDLARCGAGSGSALLVTITDVKASKGDIRIQTYRATRAEWLASGQWINRIEIPAKAGSMTFCLPFPQAGTYGVAVRHDLNANGKTDITQDGGGMSNNPEINIFNLGKPSYKKVGVAVDTETKSIRIKMKYL